MGCLLSPHAGLILMETPSPGLTPGANNLLRLQRFELLEISLKCTTRIQVCTGNTTGKPLRPVYKVMGDPRNVAHAKKVTQEKHHKASHPQKGGAPQPAKKAQTERTKPATDEQSTGSKPETEKRAPSPDSAQLEKSLAVLSTLKDFEFHSRSNIQKLAELSLTIEEELKQKAFAEAIGAVYAAQDAFQSKILKLIEDYEAECTRLSGSA
jgi:hypothetical protein